MQNIVIIGATGAGKTTVAAKMAEKLGLKQIQLDELFWQPGWGIPPLDIFIAGVEMALKEDGWVVCGNYTQLKTLVWEKADTILWLDYSFLLCFSRLMRRTLNNILKKKTICNGNVETWQRVFFSRHSILFWLVTTYTKKRKEYLSAMQDQLWKDKFIRLTSPKETRKFLEQL